MTVFIYGQRFAGFLVKRGDGKKVGAGYTKEARLRNRTVSYFTKEALDPSG